MQDMTCQHVRLESRTEIIWANGAYVVLSVDLEIYGWCGLHVYIVVDLLQTQIINFQHILMVSKIDSIPHFLILSSLCARYSILSREFYVVMLVWWGHFTAVQWNP